MTTTRPANKARNHLTGESFRLSFFPIDLRCARCRARVGKGASGQRGEPPAPPALMWTYAETPPRLAKARHQVIRFLLSTSGTWEYIGTRDEAGVTTVDTGVLTCKRCGAGCAFPRATVEDAVRLAVRRQHTRTTVWSIDPPPVAAHAATVDADSPSGPAKR